MGPLFVKSGSLLVRFGDGGQQPVSLVLVLPQQRVCLLLRQLQVVQLLQQMVLLLWQTAAHCQDRRHRYRHHGGLVSTQGQR